MHAECGAVSTWPEGFSARHGVPAMRVVLRQRRQPWLLRERDQAMRHAEKQQLQRLTRRHSKRVLAAVDSNAELTHNVTHRNGRVVQLGALALKLGRPHPVARALHTHSQRSARTLCRRQAGSMPGCLHAGRKAGSTYRHVGRQRRQASRHAHGWSVREPEVEARPRARWKGGAVGEP